MKLFKPGDRVRIREWADMAEEFGEDDDGVILCRFTFTEAMRPLCGRGATVYHVGPSGQISLAFDEPEKGSGVWTYSADMLEMMEDIPLDASGFQMSFDALMEGGAAND